MAQAGIVEMLGFGPQGWGQVLLLAAMVTFLLTLAAMAAGAVFGIAIAAAKSSAHRGLRALGEAYTTVFRGIPELLVIYLFYFGGSSLLTSVGRLFGGEGFIGMPPFIVGALAVGLISGAYQAEVYRAAALAVVPGEIEAARAIGMSRSQVWRRVLAPQVLRFALPGLGNVWQLSIKDSALVSVTGLAELMRTSQKAAGSTNEYFLFYIAAAVLYLVMTTFTGRAFSRLEAHTGRSLRRAAR
ncbi:MAG: ABC transporter permease subunit [Candidimonas sp.]